MAPTPPTFRAGCRVTMGASGDVAAALPLCHENSVASLACLAGVVPGGVVEAHSGVTVVRTGLPATGFNAAFAYELAGAPGPVEEAIDRILVRGRARWALLTTTARSPAIDALTRRFGLRRALSLTGMVRPIDRSYPAPTLPAGLTVRSPLGPGDGPAFGRTLAVGDGAPAELFDATPELFGTLPRTVTLFLGVIDGAPVSTAMLVRTGSLAGIYNVGTVPDQRRRGFGGAVTAAALRAAAAEGCRTAYLQATAMGRPVYEHLGFAAVEEYEVWAAPGPADAPG